MGSREKAALGTGQGGPVTPATNAHANVMSIECCHFKDILEPPKQQASQANEHSQPKHMHVCLHRAFQLKTKMAGTWMDGWQWFPNVLINCQSSTGHAKNRDMNIGKHRRSLRKRELTKLCTSLQSFFDSHASSKAPRVIPQLTKTLADDVSCAFFP